MSLKKVLILFSVIVLLMLTSCEPPADEGGENSGEQVEKSERKLPVEATLIKPQIVKQTIDFTGIIQPVESVEIAGEVSGKIKKLDASLGDKVTTKDTLAVIEDEVPYNQFLQSKAAVLSAENSLKISRLNFESDKVLLKNGDISQLAFENSKLAVQSAEAAYLSTKANKSLAEKQYFDTRIVSPIRGHIARKYIEKGTMVNPGSPVFRVVNIDYLKIEIGVPQGIINNVKPGNRAKIRISALNGNIYEGIVKHISPQADERTGSFKVEVHVKNSGDYKLKAGMTANVDLLIFEEEEKLTVPDYAIMKKEGKDFVYKVEDETAILTQIETAEKIGSNYVIKNGLESGDIIVTVGMKNLGEKTKVNIETLYK